MTEGDLARIEAALGLQLPEDYRAVMVNYPFAPDSWPDQAEIPNDANFIIAENVEIRKDGLYGPAWTEHHFAFGFTSAGHAFAMDTSNATSPVLLVNRETHEFSKETDTFEQWVQLRIKWYVDFDPITANEKYVELAQGVKDAGFFVTEAEPMGGWDRIIAATRYTPERGLSGNSFWVSRLESGWYLGTWSGDLYRLSDESRILACCLGCLQYSIDTAFGTDIKHQFNLVPVSEGEFGAATKAG
jgi:hypothetical protein